MRIDQARRRGALIGTERAFRVVRLSLSHKPDIPLYILS